MSGEAGINNLVPITGRFMREDGSTVNIADLFTGMSGSVKPANMIYVGKNGNDGTADGSENLPYLTISAAITAASSGTTIYVWPGTYAESITFKAGVNIVCPVEYGLYITGNHIANYNGTVICQNVIFQNASSVASGTVLAFNGTSSQNLQLLNCYINSFSTSGSGDALNWTNTNSGSKIQIIDGSVSVAHSGATARAFYSTTGSTGGLIANRTTFKLDNPDNVCLGIGGAITFTHTSDAVVGQMVIANTASLTSALCTHTTATTPVLTTSSSGMTTFLDCIDISTATPIITGAGAFSYSAIILPSTGAGSNSTLNGGIGSICLQMAPIKIRPGTLKPVTQDGLMEYDGTHLYFTIGVTRHTLV